MQIAADTELALIDNNGRRPERRDNNELILA